MTAKEKLNEVWFSSFSEILEKNKELIDQFNQLDMFNQLYNAKSSMLFASFDKLELYAGLMKKEGKFKIYINEEEQSETFDERMKAEFALFDKLNTKLEEICQKDSDITKEN